ncbi:MAG: site-specific DNA-methyltransferase [Chloroflexi bacterium]|nr:site-specific DNA-methyltransferase [Chloroflexota bacterium]MYC48366.1 site-specific DNA-methyltransferase [Chloroflexota bacterium]
MTGKQWLRNSISIWSFPKTRSDKSYSHPAVFPEALVSQLIGCFLSGTGKTVLDPFMGTGTTLAVACKHGHCAVGFELYETYIDIAAERLTGFPDHVIYGTDATQVVDFVKPLTIDMVITSPPYWNILNRRRTADNGATRPYGNNVDDIGNTESYESFLKAFADVMNGVYRVMKHGAFCVVNVMDIRLKNHLYTLHVDTMTELKEIGFKLDDIVIWDRRSDYNNLRPLGYPSTFRINRVHEYLLIFQK